jgi:hypothetical protein
MYNEEEEEDKCVVVVVDIGYYSVRISLNFSQTRN